MTSTIPAPLAGKIAIVTGGSRGIGAATALELARQGCAAIAITYASNEAAAQQVISQISSINPTIKTSSLKADILSPNFGASVISHALSSFSTTHLDIVISNAALADLRHLQPILSTTKESFDLLMAGNAFAPLSLATAALPHLRPGGRIINISSVASKRATPDPTAIYGASKAALDSITRSLAIQYSAKHEITINSIAVGPTDTDPLRFALDNLPKDIVDGIKKRASAGLRIADPKEIAAIVAFIASPAASWINGNYIPANGGAMLELQG